MSHCRFSVNKWTKLFKCKVLCLFCGVDSKPFMWVLKLRRYTLAVKFINSVHDLIQFLLICIGIIRLWVSTAGVCNVELNFCGPRKGQDYKRILSAFRKWWASCVTHRAWNTRLWPVDQFGYVHLARKCRQNGCTPLLYCFFTTQYFVLLLLPSLYYNTVYSCGNNRYNIFIEKLQNVT